MRASTSIPSHAYVVHTTDRRVARRDCVPTLRRGVPPMQGTVTLGPRRNQHSTGALPMTARRLYSAVLTVVALAACGDDSLAPTEARRPLAQATPELISEGEGIFQRYVAIGTSISMGVQGDGVYAATQQTSWPAQLARLAHRELSLPLIQAPGCSAPLRAPLATGQRTSGEGAGLTFLLRQCSPNEDGVVLPTGNVAIDGARTGHALTATPENPDP